MQNRLIANARNRDGRIDPFGGTIKQLWPLKYANPTGKKVRGKDPFGSGHHGASRGSRTHDGADYIAKAGQNVKAPISGVVAGTSRPYSGGTDAAILSGLHLIASDGTECWIWYMKPKAAIIGKVVKAGDVIGVAKTLSNRYPGITDHVHVRIRGPKGAKVNPATVIN